MKLYRCTRTQENAKKVLWEIWLSHVGYQGGDSISIKMKKLSYRVWTSAADQFIRVAKVTAQFVLPEFSEIRIVHMEIYATKQKLLMWSTISLRI